MARKKSIKYYEAVGRRRSAVVRARLYIVSGKKSVSVNGLKMGKGDYIVNKKPAKDYFPGKIAEKTYMKPLRITGCEDRFAISVLVKGGGKQGQLGAVSHGISRALLLADSEYRPLLKKEGLLTRDPRVKERRKVGTGGKARRKKQSPKR